MNRHVTTSTNTTSQGDGLTLDKLVKAIAELEAMLPVRYYVTSDYIPKLTDDGELALMMYEPTAAHRQVDPDAKGFFALHPDNLPDLQRRCRGICRLAPLSAREYA